MAELGDVNMRLATLESKVTELHQRLALAELELSGTQERLHAASSQVFLACDMISHLSLAAYGDANSNGYIVSSLEGARDRLNTMHDSRKSATATLLRMIERHAREDAGQGAQDGRN